MDLWGDLKKSINDNKILDLEGFLCYNSIMWIIIKYILFLEIIVSWVFSLYWFIKTKETYWTLLLVLFSPIFYGLIFIFLLIRCIVILFENIVIFIKNKRILRKYKRNYFMVDTTPRYYRKITCITLSSVYYRNIYSGLRGHCSIRDFLLKVECDHYKFLPLLKGMLYDKKYRKK